MEEELSLGLHPPKVPLTIRVGVTGHRDVEDSSSLQVSIQGVLGAVARIACEASHESPYLPTAPVLRVVSPLAEGADRFVAKQALAMGYELFCPLPFTPNVYKTSFLGGKSSKEEFDGLVAQASSVLILEGEESDDLANSLGNEVRTLFDLGHGNGEPRQKKEVESASKAIEPDRAVKGEEKKEPDYLPVGLAVVRQSDLLIAIWDGEGERGAGGTGEIVRAAKESGVPVIWIHSTDPLKVELLEREVAGTGDLSKLRQRLRSLVAIPEQPDRETRPDPAGDFFREKAGGWTYGYLHKALLLPLAGKWPSIKFNIHHCFRKAKEEWREGWMNWPKPNTEYFVSRGFGRHFEWADGLAECYAGKYRSTVILSYLMGACAVLLAYLGFNKDIDSSWSLASTVGELGMLIAVLVLIARGRSRHWHERWLDYRMLAELLRTMQFLALLGRVPPSFRVPPHLAHRDPQKSWVHWHFRAIVRNVGSISSLLDRAHLEACRNLISGRAEDQSEYHCEKANEARLIARNLHFLGMFLFGLAILGCVVHLTERQFHDLKLGRFELTIGIFVMVLPAFGAAIASIVHALEFERIRHRSESLGLRLKQIADGLAGDSGDLTARELSYRAEEKADILLSEFVDWRFAFLEKQLEPPV